MVVSRFSKKTFQLVRFKLCKTCVRSLFWMCFQVLPKSGAFCLAVVCWNTEANWNKQKYIMIRGEKVFKGNFKKIWVATYYSVCHMEKLLWCYIPMFNMCNDFVLSWCLLFLPLLSSLKTFVYCEFTPCLQELHEHLRSLEVSVWNN